AVLDRVVGLAAPGTQCNRHPRRDGARGHLIDSDAAESNALVDLLEAHHVAGEAVTLLAHLDIDGHLSVGHVGPRGTHIKVDAARAQHWSGQTVGDGLLRVDVAHSLSARIEYFILRNERIEFAQVLFAIV